MFILRSIKHVTCVTINNSVTCYFRYNIMMMKYGLIYFLLVGFAFSSCSDSSSTAEEKEPIASDETDHSRAIELLESKCFACHNNNVPKQNALAPPMIAVKEAYRENTEDRAAFIERFVDFVSSPTREKALLKEAVNEYNLMAYEGTKKEDLEKIAAYLYDEEIAKPLWWGDQDASTPQDTSLAAVGLNYALSTKKALGKRLMGALEKGGPSYAVEFCNTRAIAITDSVSRHFNATIKRVSDKPRNPDNSANEHERNVIDEYKEMLAQGKDLQPITVEENGATRFYYPIKTNAMCLKCHGDPSSQIDESTLSKLTKLYPADQAKGYDENEIRGIWSILFESK